MKVYIWGIRAKDSDEIDALTRKKGGYYAYLAVCDICSLIVIYLQWEQRESSLFLVISY